MPTPLALTLGLQHAGGDFHAACACSENEFPVFIVSGRNVEDASRHPDPFGTDRSRQPNLGIAYVSIGEELTSEELHHDTVSDEGNKKAITRFKRIELSDQPIRTDPWQVKDPVVRLTDHPWVQSLKQHLDQSPSRSVCIFVHGYNTEFVDNTLLAGEIYHYLGRQGAIISYEWPSESKLLGYIADKGNAMYSTRHFRGMLSNIAKECSIDSITIIAHSAGSPIVVRAMHELRLLEQELNPHELQEKYKIESVVLAAPDMDLLQFINSVYDRFYEVAKRVAVYASPKDRALLVSSKLYGNERLGRSVGNLEDWEKEVLGRVDQIYMIDASKAENMFDTFLGHSYFHRDPWISSDIGLHILGKHPSERGLERQDGEIFWRFPLDYPNRLKKTAERLP